MRRKSRAKSKGRASESTRLTPKSAKDVKVIRIRSVAYNAVYFLAEENNMTMTDAVSFMVGLAWKQLYKVPINAPGPTRNSGMEDPQVRIERAILKLLRPDAEKDAT